MADSCQSWAAKRSACALTVPAQFPEMDRDRQVARTEVAAPRAVAGLVCLLGLVDAAGAARKPWVERDPLARIPAAPDYLVAGHVLIEGTPAP